MLRHCRLYTHGIYQIGNDFWNEKYHSIPNIEIGPQGWQIILEPINNKKRVHNNINDTQMIT